MHILSIVTYYAPHWTGLTQHAQRVAEGLAARGHQVTVLTSRYDAELPAAEQIEGVQVRRLRTLGRLSRGMLMPGFVLAAVREIGRADVVHIHTPMLESLLVALLCRLLGKPLLMSHHGDLVMPAGLFNRFTERVVTAMMSTAGTLADRVTTYSDDYAAHSAFLQQFADHLTAISPPVQIPAPLPAHVRALCAELGLDGKRVVGFAGRFVEEKGFDFLIAAVPLIKRRLPDVHFVFAGETNVVYERFFQKLAPEIERLGDDITLLGLIRDPQKLATFYALCDVFTLPSRTDCFALVQVEALLCGAPLVTADIPGARVVVRRTGMGRLVAPRDPQALADGIVDVLEHPERYRPDTVRVASLFDLQTTTQRYETALEELIASRQPDCHDSTLRAQDRQKLDLVLRNEADMAFRRRAVRLIDWLELRDGDRVFDCGCGMGFYLMALGELRPLRLFGLDGDLERLRWAQREQVPAALLSGDILKLPFPDASFDKIMMSEVLEHIPDDEAALREVYRVLKPGGILALSVPHARFPFWWDPINHLWIALGGQPIRSGPIAGIWSNHERLYEPADLRMALWRAGFDLQRVEQATHYSFPLIHFLVYGIGKPLIEHNLLPRSLRNSADRFAGKRNSGSLLNPINAGLALFRAIDRLNERPAAAAKRSWVNVLVQARKPADP